MTKSGDSVRQISADAEAELGVTTPSTHQLNDLQKIVSEFIMLRSDIAVQEERTKGDKVRLHTMATETLPSMLASAGVSEFTTQSGTTVEIKDYVSGTLPRDDEEKRAAALAAVRDAGGDGIIKVTVTCYFGKSEAAKAVALAKKLKASGLEPEVKEDIHPQTLWAWVREGLRKGRNVALDQIGVSVGLIAKVKEMKEK